MKDVHTNNSVLYLLFRLELWQKKTVKNRKKRCIYDIWAKETMWEVTNRMCYYKCKRNYPIVHDKNN